MDLYMPRVQRARPCPPGPQPGLGALCVPGAGWHGRLGGLGVALGLIQGGITCQTVAGLVVGTETLPTAPPRMAVCAELPQMVLHGVERRDCCGTGALRWRRWRRVSWI